MNEPNESEISRVLTSATENATTIHPTDASTQEQRDRFSRLSKYNRGIWNGPKRENKEVTRRQDNRAIFDALAGQLGLTNYQKGAGRHIIDELDLPNIGHPISLVAFATCVLVANDDVPDGFRYWPRANNADEDFQRVAANLPYGPDTILSVMLVVDDRRDTCV